MSDNDVKITLSLAGADTAEKGLRGVGDGASAADSKLGSFVGKGLAGAGKALVGFTVAAAAAGGALALNVVKQFSEYQQNVGGIEKLFGSSATQMEKYAADAYKTAGISANDFLNQSTSFAAALLRGLGGDQKKAAELANTAIVDMSDNANVFGSNIGSIQFAYQGFAKQNYTMLDNLKLGFGGTAAEMARLVNQSHVMGDGFTATATNINSVPFDKIVSAIHAVQVQMGVAGDTAKEASTTIQGSMMQLKSAWTNLLTGLGSADSDIGTLASNVITSFQNVVTNITPVIQAIGTNMNTLGPELGKSFETIITALAGAIPAIIQTGVALVGGLITGITTSLPALVTALVPAIVQLVQVVAELAPKLVVAGAQAIVALATGLAGAMPTLIPAIVGGVLGMVQALIDAGPSLIAAGLQLLQGLATGLIAAIPVIVAALPQLIAGIVSYLTQSVPTLLQAGVTLFTGLIQALPGAIAQILAVLPTLITSIITALLSAIPLLIQAGISLLVALVGALPQIIETIVVALPAIITGIITAIVGAIPLLVQAGINLLVALIQALPTIIVAIVTAIPKIIVALVAGIVSAIPAIIKAGVQLLISLIKDMPTIIGAIIKAIPQIVTGIFGAFTDPKMTAMIGRAGLQLIQGLWNGISDAAGWLNSKIAGFFGGVVSNIKSFFGIHSPSKLMADEIGAMLPAGIGIGVTVNAKDAIQPIQDLNTQIMAEASKLNTTVAFTHDSSITQSLVPMQATAQQQGPVTVQATLDPFTLSSAIADSFAANGSQDQAAVALSKDSINQLASAIITGMRTQSRQGVVISG